MRNTGRSWLTCTGAVLWLSIALDCATQSQVPANPDRSVGQNSSAPSQAELRARVDALLSQTDGGTKDADWKLLGASAMPILEQIYTDRAAPPSKRARAVDSLAQVDSPDATGKLKAILADSSAGAQYRSTAAVALGRREGPAAAEWIHPLLGDSNRNVRKAAIQGLASIGGDQARRSLEDRLPKEEDPQLREFIQRSLIKIQP